MLRVVVITSQFPLPGELQRGRAVYQTIQHLGEIAVVTVISPVASYPLRLRPRSYTYHAAPRDFDTELAVRYVEYPVLPLVSRPFNGWLCARALGSTVENANPDVILSYWLYPDAFGAMLVANRLRLPFVAGARGSDLRTRDPVCARLVRRVVRQADRLIVVSKDLERIAVKRDGAASDKVSVIPNGCDSSIFRLRDRRNARLELGVPLNTKLLLYVGRLVPEKGLRELMTAMTIMRKSGPQLRLAVAGHGPMRPEIERLIADARQDDVSLLGAQTPLAVATWMAASDVVVLPSYSEGHPNVLIEALACGRPFVATPVGGILEIADDHCSVLVPPRDPQALARGIEQALNRNWDEAGLARLHCRSWEDVALQTLDVCTRAVKSAKGP